MVHLAARDERALADDRAYRPGWPDAALSMERRSETEMLRERDLGHGRRGLARGRATQGTQRACDVGVTWKLKSSLRRITYRSLLEMNAPALAINLFAPSSPNTRLMGWPFARSAKLSLSLIHI